MVRSKIRGFDIWVATASETGNLTNTYTHYARNGYRVELWYDARSRNWVVQTKDENGYQILSADYVGTREDGEAAFEQRCYAQAPTPAAV